MEDKIEQLKIFSPIIQRWIDSSKSAILTTSNKIVYLFSKCYYLMIADKIGIFPNYSTILSDSLLNHYQIRLESLPAYNKYKIKNSKKKIQHVSIPLQDLIPELERHEKDEQKKIFFFLEVVNRAFSKVCEQLKTPLKSDLRKNLNINFSRLYEFRILLDNLKRIIPEKFDTERDQNLHLRYGGYPGAFYDYLFSNLRLILSKSRNVKHKFLPKNKEGSFFTPSWLNEYINLTVLRYWVQKNQSNIESSKDFRSSTSMKFPNIADISAGFGYFVEKFVEPEFILRIKSIFKSNNLPISGDLGKFIFAYDSNEFFIDILKLNQSLLKRIGVPTIKPSNFIAKNTLIEDLGRKYDILVGNPPWGSQINKNKILKIHELRKFANKQFDSYSLFAAKNIISLNENGILFLVLPETILLNPNYVSLREYILKNTTLLEIIHLGENIFDEVNMPCIVMGLKNKKPEPHHKVKIISNFSTDLKKRLFHGEIDLFELINERNRSEIQASDIPEIFERDQDSFNDNLGYSFDIFSNDQDREILEAMNELDCYRLKDLVVNSRGVEIGKKGEVLQCYTCGVWMPIPQWHLDTMTGGKSANCSVCKNPIEILKVKKRENIIIPIPEGTLAKGFNEIDHDFILIGEDVHQFYTSGESIIKLSYRGIKYKNKPLYKVKKIIMRKTSNKIDATIDYEGRYVIQVVYQFSLNEAFSKYRFLLEYILGILNSKAIQYFYSKKFQYQGRKNFPHHIQANILNLPIPKIDFNNTDSKSYKLYIKISFYTMVLMLLYQMSRKDELEKGLLREFDDFISYNNEILVELGIIEEFHNKFSEEPSFFLKSVQSYSKNKKIEEIQNKINYYKEKLDSAVESIFKLQKET